MHMWGPGQPGPSAPLRRSPRVFSAAPAPANLLRAALLLPPGIFEPDANNALDPLELTALHEAGHAVAWHFGGGELARIAIGRARGTTRGMCTYRIDRLSPHQRRLLARAAFAGPLICDVAGHAGWTSAWLDDYAAAALALRPLYRSERGLRAEMRRCWLDAAGIVGCPAGLRCAVALADRLVRVRTLYGFPPECDVGGLAPVPGLAERAALLAAGVADAMSFDIPLAIEEAARRAT